MPEKEPFKDPELFELSTWETLVKTDEWKYYLVLLDDHKEYLTKECLRYIAKQDFHNAVRSEAKVEDMEKIIDLVMARLKQLRIGGDNGKH